MKLTLRKGGRAWPEERLEGLEGLEGPQLERGQKVVNKHKLPLAPGLRSVMLAQ